MLFSYLNFGKIHLNHNVCTCSICGHFLFDSDITTQHSVTSLRYQYVAVESLLLLLAPLTLHVYFLVPYSQYSSSTSTKFPPKLVSRLFQISKNETHVLSWKTAVMRVIVNSWLANKLRDLKVKIDVLF